MAALLVAPGSLTGLSGLAAAAAAQLLHSSLTVAVVYGCCRLVITGSGFSQDKFAGGNVVYVGSQPCTVLNHKTSDTLVRKS